jgi:hypothetical protein
MTNKMIAATCNDLTAVVTNPIITSRLVVPLYNDGNLQSTLTHKITGTLVKLAFAGPQYLCGLMQSDDASKKSIVVVWNVTRGVVVHTLEEEGILDMATTDDESLVVLVQHKKAYIQEYALDEAKLKLVRKIKAGKVSDEDSTDKWTVAAHGDKLCVLMDGIVKVLGRESGSKLHKCKLSSTAAGNIMVMSDKYVAACTASQVQVFSISTGKLVTSAAITEPPTQVLIQENYLLIDSSLYRIGKNTSTAVSTLQEEEAAVMQLFFSSDSSTEVQAIVQGKKGIDIFQIPFVNDDGQVMSKIEIPKPSEEDEEEKSSKKRTPSVTKTLGPGQAGGETVQVTDRPVKKSKTVEDDDEEDDGPTIAERLQRLQQVLDEEDAMEALQFKPKQATTESLSHLLDQALSSSDDSMLELALNVRDAKVRQHSIDDLAVEQATLLLNKLTARLAKKPNRASALVPWIQILLLSGKIQSSAPLVPLRNLVQERIEVFPQLLQLEGRLALLANMQ